MVASTLFFFPDLFFPHHHRASSKVTRKHCSVQTNWTKKVVKDWPGTTRRSWSKSALFWAEEGRAVFVVLNTAMGEQEAVLTTNWTFKIMIYRDFESNRD